MKYWRVILPYALLLCAALAVLKLLEYQFFSYRARLDGYLGGVALFFLLFGIGLSWLLKPWKKAADEPDPAVLSKFSSRELEVLQLVAKGYSNKEVGRLLDISPNTVKTHMSNLYDKLEVGNRTQAVAEAKALHLL